jgi:hypothetical protein
MHAHTSLKPTQSSSKPHSKVDGTSRLLASPLNRLISMCWTSVSSIRFNRCSIRSARETSKTFRSMCRMHSMNCRATHWTTRFLRCRVWSCRWQLVVATDTSFLIFTRIAYASKEDSHRRCIVIRQHMTMLLRSYSPTHQTRRLEIDVASPKVVRLTSFFLVCEPHDLGCMIQQICIPSSTRYNSVTFR